MGVTHEGEDVRYFQSGWSSNPALRSISGVLLCYNDARTIATMVEALRACFIGFAVPFEIIVVDDGSVDDSLLVLRELQNTLADVRVIEHGTNRGYGAAVRSGFATARYEWVFYTDGDGQYDPSEVVVLAEQAGPDVDWVQGWKIARSDDVVRKVVGRVYHHTVRLLFRTNVRDTDCDFRLIRRTLLQKAALTANSGAICVEMLYKFRRAGGRVVEVPVHHYPRAHGRSQFFRLPTIASSLRELLGVWIRLVVFRRQGA